MGFKPTAGDVDGLSAPLARRSGRAGLRVKNGRLYWPSVHWRSVKYPVISVILGTTANEVTHFNRFFLSPLVGNLGKTKG